LHGRLFLKLIPKNYIIALEERKVAIIAYIVSGAGKSVELLYMKIAE
jgi:hypothetical protein